MQIICIYAGVSHNKQKLDYVVNVFGTTLSEIGVKVETIDISNLNLNYYNGTKVSIIENIFNNIKNSQGVIFATTAQRFSVNGAMQVFLDHFDYELYGNVLYEKPCISIITSSDNSEYMAGNYMNTLMGSLGAIAFNNMIIGKDYLKEIEMSIPITQMIEKYAEDFYRVIKQNRKFFVSNPFKFIDNNKTVEEKQNNYYNNKNYEDLNKEYSNIEPIRTQEGKQVRNLTGSQVANLYKKETENIYNNKISNSSIKRDTVNIDYNNVYKSGSYIQSNYFDSQYNNKPNLYSKPNDYNKDNIKNIYTNKGTQDINNTIENFNSSQQDDIDEIAMLLSEKYREESNLNQGINEFMSKRNNVYNKDISPSINSIKQRTQSLYHYFQPQLANGIDTIMQISISGRENFNGFFTIKNGECFYSEGVYPSPEVSIISDSSVWEEVLSGKSTLQRAFMLGRLKVKGNFVIISKFEQFFKII